MEWKKVFKFIKHWNSRDTTSSTTMLGSESSISELMIDDIKTEYHPRSGWKTCIQHFEECHHFPAASANDAFYVDEPWWPFRCWTDFKFAEIALTAALTHSQTESLIQLINSIVMNIYIFIIISFIISLIHFISFIFLYTPPILHSSHLNVQFVSIFDSAFHFPFLTIDNLPRITRVRASWSSSRPRTCNSKSIFCLLSCCQFISL